MFSFAVLLLLFIPAGTHYRFADASYPLQIKSVDSPLTLAHDQFGRLTHDDDGLVGSESSRRSPYPVLQKGRQSLARARVEPSSIEFITTIRSCPLSSVLEVTDQSSVEEEAEGRETIYGKTGKSKVC